MTLLSTLKSRKALAGMVAVAAGTATVAAPVVALPLSAAPGGDATGSPAVNGADTGTYESCSALFGLTDKNDANYVTFNVAGTADPLPGIGQGLTPVLTVTNPESGNVEECVPEIGFNDAESWLAYIDATVFEENAELVVPYPGSPGYLVPIYPIYENVFTPANGPTRPAPLSIALRIETDSTVNPADTVTWTPLALSYPLPASFGEIMEMIEMELGGPTSPLAILFNTIFFQADFNLCRETPDQTIQDLLTTVLTVTGIPQSLLDGITDDPCGQLVLAPQFSVFQQSVAALGLPVAVTVNAPAPAPAPTPPPGPAPTPVTPRFTG